MSRLQKCRVRGQYDLPSTVSNVETQSKTNKQMKAHGPTRLESAASSSNMEQVQSLAAPGHSPGWLLRGLLLPQEIPLSCRTPGMQLGEEPPLSPYSQKSRATVGTPSSNGFGIPVGCESGACSRTPVQVQTTHNSILVESVAISQTFYNRAESLDGRIQKFLSHARKHVISLLTSFVQGTLSRTRNIASSHLVMRCVLIFDILPEAHPCGCSIRGETQVL